jgi:hypothetical protein
MLSLSAAKQPAILVRPMAEKDLSALFLDTLKDIYYAEKQIYKALPKMAKAASSDQLRAAFEKHHDETEGQIERLEPIFELMGKPARGKKCDARVWQDQFGAEAAGQRRDELGAADQARRQLRKETGAAARRQDGRLLQRI